LPVRIELFDNSHLQGSSPVGAMVVFINGEPVKKMYRKFHIEQNEKRNDLASMKEVIYRRYSRLVNEAGELPDLILVDGGLEQVKAASESLTKVGIDIPLFGLFKNDKHQTRGVVAREGTPIDLVSEPSLFFLLVRMQDEVHRYAISFHRALERKKATKSLFDDIPGFGPKRRQLIEQTYRSLDELRQASLQELEQMLPSQVALALYRKLQNTNTN